MGEVGYLDMEIYQHLFDKLQGYFHNSDLQLIFDDIRKDIPLVNQPSLKAIHQSTLNCTKCPELAHDAVLPQWNITDPDLVVVLPDPYLTESGKDSLIKALKGAGFSATRTALTYLNRCSKRGKYSDEEINTCSTYLFGELSHWQPKLTIFMGGACSVMLYGSENKTRLSDITGTIHWMGPHPYMVSESPNSVEFSKIQSDFNNYFTVAYDFCY